MVYTLLKQGVNEMASVRWCFIRVSVSVPDLLGLVLRNESQRMGGLEVGRKREHDSKFRWEYSD